MPLLLVIVTLVATLTSPTTAHREHKVHNIVLYPDKHSWCRTTTIKQVISYPGYHSVEIDNNVCVGACFSYSIPHTEPSDPGEVIVPYCDSCQPLSTTWNNVTLQCTQDATKKDGRPIQLVKRVQIITNCSCSSCDPSARTPLPKMDLTTSNKIADEVSIDANISDIPDLLDVVDQRANNYSAENSSSKEIPSVAVIPPSSELTKQLMNNKLIGLLQSIQEKNSVYDKEQLKDMLQLLHIPLDHQLSDKAFSEFIDSLASEHIELDVNRLKEIFVKLESNQQFDAMNDDNYVNNNSSAEGEDESHLQNQQPPHLEEIQQSGIMKERTDFPGNGKDISGQQQLYQHHHQNNHLHQLHHHHHHHHHQHHVGDAVRAGHLVKGPRGALVIEPDATSGHKKLDVNSHELKANHAGTMVSYDSHIESVSKD